MKLKIEVTGEDIRDLILDQLKSTLDDLSLNKEDVCIEVQLKQNYEIEWSTAAFHVVVEK